MRKNLFFAGFIILLSQATLIAAFNLDFIKNPFLDFFHNIEDKFGKKHDKQVTAQNKEKSPKELKNVGGQDCQANNFLIIKDTFPYWNEVDQFPCMYSGTLNASLSKDQDHNLFFWLFKNTVIENPPLVLWINGGPGSSSMFGLFQENGPIQITRTGMSADDYLIGLRKDSWLDVADVVYLDQPVGTGFSYGNSVLNSMEDGGSEFINFIRLFLGVFPEYAQQNGGRQFILSGESYAGKYLPLFALNLTDYNNDPDTIAKINLTTVLIGDPFASPAIQRTSTHKVAQGLGIIEDRNLEQVATLRKNCEEAMGNNWTFAPDICEETMNYIDEVGGNVFTYDGRIFDYDWTPIGSVLDDFLLNSGKNVTFYDAIHISQSTKYPLWVHSNSNVSNAYSYDIMVDYTDKYDQMLELGYKVLIYAGEWDQRDGAVTMEPWLRNSHQLKGDGVKDFWDKGRDIYQVKKGDGSFIIGGYYRYDPNNNFTLLTVPKSGHFVPTNQLLITKQFLTDYIEAGQLRCHKDNPIECQSSAIMCEYMNNCNGNGICKRNGQCFCDDNYKSADCSEKAELLNITGYEETIPTNGTQWKYFQFNEAWDPNDYYYAFSLSSNYPLDIYISSGGDSDPNEFNYEIALRQQNYVLITSDNFPSLYNFTAAVKVNGIDFYDTLFFNNTILAKFENISRNPVPPTSHQTQKSEHLRSSKASETRKKGIHHKQYKGLSESEEGESFIEQVRKHITPRNLIIGLGIVSVIYIFRRKREESSQDMTKALV